MGVLFVVKRIYWPEESNDEAMAVVKLKKGQVSLSCFILYTRIKEGITVSTQQFRYGSQGLLQKNQR